MLSAVGRCCHCRPLPTANRRLPALQSSLVPRQATSSLSSLTSSFAGLSLASPAGLRPAAPGRSSLVITAGGSTGKSMGAMLNGTRRKRVRVSGFRARKLTHGGRNVIKARRKKGRHTICPAYLFKKP